MTSGIFSLHAQTQGWGQPKSLPSILSGQYEVRITATSESNVPSSFEIRAEYYDESGRYRMAQGFDTLRFTTERDATETIEAQAKAHSFGQMLRVQYWMKSI
jgi:hypothetical protein